jgi:hypothetical protein
MINETELTIANKSYTNKDFASIYPELLELAKKLTNKWDPSTSNESDPGVVLLKLLAFIADKNNYNIDKNILESFMPSATQESSMRKLSEMNGYEMEYYKSAMVDVTFMYKGRMSDGSGNTMTISLPAYDTVITGVEGISTYVLLDKVDLTERGVSVTKKAIEGTLQYLRGTDGSYIQLNNLDDNNRLYFPERFVASNGIFITNIGELNNLWDRVDNLNTEVPSTKCFKFGFDSSRNLPYIEFPKDIASLIGEGLDIRYIITQGVDGNVKANFLTKLYNTTDLSLFAHVSSEDAEAILKPELTNLVINNNSASIGGANPESINEAYNNFKRVVGTFNTLVTCKDYANFIYRLEENYRVSNVQVADRRTDINYGNNILTFNEFGKYVTSNEDKTKITPFDLLVYPLNSTNDNYDETSYYNSFKPNNSPKKSLEDSIENVKTISHDIKNLISDDIFLFKNYYLLNVRITTTTKVSSSEATSIVNNVKQALYKHFNAREIDYGYEIPYDTIYSVIESADPRIKNISLDEPEIQTKVMKADSTGTEINYTDIIDNESEHEKLLAKNILAGRISLFDYYEDFKFDFYKTQRTGTSPVIDELEKISTEVSIDKTDLQSGYVLKENEVIQLIGSNLTTKVTYPSYINFRYSGSPVASGTEYKLNTGESLKINYTDTNDYEQNIEYGPGTIIRTNFELKDTGTNSDRATITKEFNGVNIEMNTLTVNETIEIRDYVTSTLNKTLKCYWLLDEQKNPDNCLFRNGQSEIILSEGESFLYTDDAMTELVVIGSGTKLTIATPPTDSLTWSIDRTKLISKESILDKGLAAFSIFDWRTFDFTANNLIIQEMAIYSFGKDVTVKISDIQSGKTAITNELIEIPSNATIEYKETGATSFTKVPQYSISGVTWKVRSRLDLNTGPDRGQKIEENQTITFKKGVNEEINVIKESGKNTMFKLNVPIQHAGGEDIDVMVTTYVDQVIDRVAKVSAFVYNDASETGALQRNADTNLISYEIKNYTEPIVLPVVLPADKTTLIMFYWNKPTDDSVTTTDIEVEVTGGTITKYNQTNSDGVLSAGLNILEISEAVTEIKITATGATSSTSDTLLIGEPTIINGLNYSRFGWKNTDVALTESLLARIAELSTRKIDGEDVNIFYYNAPLDASNLIEVEDLSTPHALFDSNNLANQFTLAQIDVRNSFIDVVRSSRL